MAREVAQGVARNTSIMLAQQAITMGSSFLLMLFLPRYLGPVEYGKLFLIMSVTAMLEVFVNYGGNFLIAKQVSRDRRATAEIFVDSVSLRLLLAGAAYLVLMAIAWGLGYAVDVRILFVVYGIGIFVSALIGSLYACFLGNEMMQYTSAAALADRLLLSGAGIALLLAGGGALAMAGLMVICSLVALAVMAWFARKMIHALPKTNWHNVRQQVRDGLPYFLFAAFGNIYLRLDSLILSKLSPEEVVGYYGGAFRFFETLNFPYLFGVALYPALSRLWTEEGDAHRRAAVRSLEYVVLVGLPLAAGGIYFAREVIGLFYGLEKFEASVPILQVLAAGLPFLYVDMIMWTTLISSDRQRQLTWISLFTIPVTLVLNLLLIPLFQSWTGNGGIGSAVATGLREAFIFVLSIRLMPPGLVPSFRLALLWKSLAACGVMMLGVVAMMEAGIPWPPVIALAIPLYFFVHHVLRTLEKQEVVFFREEIGRALSRMLPRTLRKAPAEL